MPDRWMSLLQARWFWARCCGRFARLQRPFHVPRSHRLMRPQIGIKATFCHKLRMCACFNNLPLIHHNEAIKRCDGRKPMRNRNHGFTCINSVSCSWIADSTWLSSADVASSRTRFGASFKSTRAMEIRCRCPPDIWHRAPQRGYHNLCVHLYLQGSQWNHALLLGAQQFNFLLRCLSAAISNIITDRAM